MRSKSVSLFVFLIVLGLFFISGCEEKSTTPAIEGEPDDSGFETMSDLNELSFETLKIPFDLTDTVLAMSGLSATPFKAHKITTELLNYHSLVYTYSEFWHIFSFSAVLIITEEGQTDSLQISGIDSLRYKNSGVIVQYPDELLTDEMNIRQHVDINAYSAEGGVIQIKDHANINVTTESFAGNTMTFDGVIHDSVAIVTEELGEQILDCEVELTSTQTYNDLVIDDTQDCPTSGTIGMSAYYSIDCVGNEGSLSLESTWIATFTFGNGMVSIDIYSGGQHWQSSTVCGGV